MICTVVTPAHLRATRLRHNMFFLIAHEIHADTSQGCQKRKTRLPPVNVLTLRNQYMRPESVQRAAVHMMISW